MNFHQAMAPHEAHLRSVWGDQYDALVRYTAFATRRPERELERFGQAVDRDPKTRTLFVIGTRYASCFGLQADIVAAAADIMRALDGGINKGHATTRLFQILISGGCWGIEHLFDDRPGLLLLDDFRERLGNRFDPWLSVDQTAQNTGHQALMLGRLAASPLNFSRVVMALPIDHLPRFAATVAFEFKRLGILADEVLDQFFFFGVGEWDMPTRHGRFTMHEEAFAPKQGEDDPRLIAPWRPLGGELAERWQGEQNPENWGKLNCGALSPTEMCQRLRLF